MRAGCSSRSLGPETASYEVRRSPRCAYLRREHARHVDLADRWARVLQPFGAAREPVLDRIQDRAAIAHRAEQGPARRALAQQRRSASVGTTRATAGAHPAESGSSRTARRIPVDCFLENAAPDEDGSDGHHPQHGHDDADRARGAKARRRKQQHCNRAADGAT